MIWQGFTEDSETREHISFFCVRCGGVYKTVHGCSESSTYHWQYCAGLCGNCPPDKWNINLSLECMTFSGWKNVPKEVLLYQLESELDFYDWNQRNGT